MITVIKSPFIQYKLTILRNKKTSNTVFRQTMNEISYLIASDVLQYVPFKKQTIETPLKKMSGTALGQPIILVPILRAGLGLLEGFWQIGLFQIVCLGRICSIKYNPMNQLKETGRGPEPIKNN